MKNSYVLNIAGSSFSILSEESQDYIHSIEKQVEDMVLKAQAHGASPHKAALFVCMQLCDMLNKSQSSSELDKKRPKKSFEEVLSPDKAQTTLF